MRLNMKIIINRCLDVNCLFCFPFLQPSHFLCSKHGYLSTVPYKFCRIKLQISHGEKHFSMEETKYLCRVKS